MCRAARCRASCTTHAPRDQVLGEGSAVWGGSFGRGGPPGARWHILERAALVPPQPSPHTSRPSRSTGAAQPGLRQRRFRLGALPPRRQDRSSVCLSLPSQNIKFACMIVRWDHDHDSQRARTHTQYPHAHTQGTGHSTYGADGADHTHRASSAHVRGGFPWQIAALSFVTMNCMRYFNQRHARALKVRMPPHCPPGPAFSPVVHYDGTCR